MTIIREQIDAALAVVACEVETHRHDMSPTLEQSYRVLLSAIPALTAELEAERASHARTRGALSLMTDARDTAIVSGQESIEAERKAHAETGRQWDEMRVLLVDSQAIARGAQQARDAARSQLATWQRATGHASPEAYRASRAEPGADVIERLRPVFIRAYSATTPFSVDDGIRAVVAALAEMGASLMPSAEGCYENLYEGADIIGAIRSTLDDVHERLAPVLGARRALELPSEEEIANAIHLGAGGVQHDKAGGGARAVLDLIRSRSVESSYVPRAFGDSTIELALSWLEPFANASPRFGAAVAAIGVIKAYRYQRNAAHPTDEQLAEEARLKSAIRRITVDAPNGEPNGPAEEALCALQEALHPSRFAGGRDRVLAALQEANGHGARLASALADETRELRLSADAYFGEDFTKPAGARREGQR